MKKERKKRKTQEMRGVSERERKRVEYRERYLIQARAYHAQGLGKLGPASGVRKIDPETGKVLGNIETSGRKKKWKMLQMLLPPGAVEVAVNVKFWRLWRRSQADMIVRGYRIIKTANGWRAYRLPKPDVAKRLEAIKKQLEPTTNENVTR